MVYFVISQLNYVLITTMCLFITILPLFIHASFRLRNLSAKINLEFESAHFRRTVMASIFDFLGINVKWNARKQNSVFPKFLKKFYIYIIVVGDTILEKITNLTNNFLN